MKAVAAVVVLAVLVGAAAAGPHARREPPADQYIRYLESPERAAWQRPRDVVAALALRDDETVVDLGAGSGYFTLPLARAVPKGRVLALDVDPKLLEHVAGRARSDALTNVETRLVPRDDPKLEPKSVDVVFLCNVYHHIEDRSAYLAKLRAALRAGGRIAIVDFHKRADVAEGPPFEEKLARETVAAEFRDAGFRLAAEHGFLPMQYFLVFERGRDALAELVDGVAAALRAGGPEPEVLEAVAPHLRQFLAAGVLDARATRPHPGLDVTTVLLHAASDGSFSIAALVIRPGRATPVHDHQTWTVWGTLPGSDASLAKEVRFRRSDSTAGDFPDLQPISERVLPPGEVSLIPGPPGDIHRVENVGSQPSVSIHVHGADLSRRTRNAYDLNKRVVIPFVQSYESLDAASHLK